MNNPFKRTNSNNSYNLMKDSDNLNQIHNEYEGMNTNFFSNNDSNANINKNNVNEINKEFNKENDFIYKEDNSRNFGSSNLGSFMQPNYLNFNNDKSEEKINNNNYQNQTSNTKNNGMIGNFNININNFNSFNMNFNNIKKDGNDEPDNNNLIPNSNEPSDDNTNALLEKIPNPSEIFNNKNEQ